MYQAPVRQPLGPDQMYCPRCGTVIARVAACCPHCGQMFQHVVTSLPGNKDKTVAVLLAVFLGFWTWIYTYDTDAWKFWLNLALSVLSCGVWSAVAWVWALIEAASRSDDFYRRYPYGI